jgi:hypothetical protein
MCTTSAIVRGVETGLPESLQGCQPPSREQLDGFLSAMESTCEQGAASICGTPARDANMLAFQAAKTFAPRAHFIDARGGRPPVLSFQWERRSSIRIRGGASS